MRLIIDVEPVDLLPPRQVCCLHDKPAPDAAAAMNRMDAGVEDERVSAATADKEEAPESPPGLFRQSLAIQASRAAVSSISPSKILCGITVSLLPRRRPR